MSGHGTGSISAIPNRPTKSLEVGGIILCPDQDLKSKPKASGNGNMMNHVRSSCAGQVHLMGWRSGSILLFALFIRFLAELPHDHASPTDTGKNFVEIAIIALTLLVITVPEGLPLAATLSFAFATTRILKDNN